MAQSISFGTYTIHIDGSKLTVLDHSGQVVATADLTVDAAAKIPLPNGQVLDVGQLADALASDHIVDFATAAGGSAAGGTGGSGMFFHNAHAQGLGGFNEMQVIKAGPEAQGTTPSTEDQQPAFSQTVFFAQQNPPASENIPSPPRDQLPVDNPPANSHAGGNGHGNYTPGSNPPDNSHAGGNAGGNDAPGNNPPDNSNAGGNAGGNGTPGDNPPDNSHAGGNAGGNDTPGDNPPADSHAGGNAGGDDTPGDNPPADSHAGGNGGGNGTPDNNPPTDSNAGGSGGGNGTPDNNPPADSYAGNNGGNGTPGDNPPDNSHAGGNAGGNDTPGSNPPADSHAGSNGGGSDTPGNNPQPDNTQASNTPIDNAPVAADEIVSTKEDTPLHGSVDAADADGDHLSYSLVNGPQHGTVSFNSDGTYTYTPNADYNGTDSLTYKASDGSLSSNTGTVNLTITPVNDAPVATNTMITTAEDAVVQNHVTATDVDGDHLTYSLVNGPQHGTVTFSDDGNFVYKPLSDYFGTDSFTYQASDGSLGSNTGSVNLTITPVDDAPVIGADTTVLDHYENLAGASTQSQTFAAQPHVQITDVDSTQMSTATIDTHGFQHGDLLHIGSSSLFNVAVSQSGDDYHISITAKAGSESTTSFQDFINSISFTSSSTHDGVRTLDYTVTDDQHVVSNTAHGAINIQSSYEVWASQLAPSQNATGSGDDILHLDGKLTGKFDMGAGDDTVHFEINNGTFNHQAAPNLQNVEHIDTTGSGNNTVSLSISDVLNMTDGDHFLSIIGDKSDTVALTGDNSSHHWQQTGSHDGFNVYTWSDPNHAAVVEISQMMHQSAT